MKVKIYSYFNCNSYYISEPYNFVIQINNNIKTLNLFRSTINNENCDIIEINNDFIKECYDVLLAQEQVEQLKKNLFKKI